MHIAYPVSFDDVLDDWARAELDHIAQWLDPDAVARIRNDMPKISDSRMARLAIFLRRRPVLLPFLSRPTDWYAGRIESSKLEFLNTYLFHDEGYNTVGDLTRRHPNMTIADFDPAKTRGRPVVVCSSPSEAVYLIEGTHRCCEMVCLHRPGYFEAEMPVLVGVCSRLDEIIALSKEAFADVPKAVR